MLRLLVNPELLFVGDVVLLVLALGLDVLEEGLEIDLVLEGELYLSIVLPELGLLVPTLFGLS